MKYNFQEFWKKCPITDSHKDVKYGGECDVQIQIVVEKYEESFHEICTNQELVLYFMGMHICN